MTLTELAALVSPQAAKTVKAVKSRRGKRKARRLVQQRRPQGRQDLGYDPLTDTFRPFPWACDDREALSLAQARNVLAGHHTADHSAGACPITRTALAVIEAERTTALSAKRIRETGINAPTVRTRAVTETELAALVRGAVLMDKLTDPVAAAAGSTD